MDHLHYLAEVELVEQEDYTEEEGFGEGQDYYQGYDGAQGCLGCDCHVHSDVQLPWLVGECWGVSGLYSK